MFQNRALAATIDAHWYRGRDGVPLIANHSAICDAGIFRSCSRPRRSAGFRDYHVDASNRARQENYGRSGHLDGKPAVSAAGHQIEHAGRAP
jgi:hypothetical protein